MVSLSLSLSGQDQAGTGRDSDMAAPPEMPIVIDHVALKDILGPQLFEMEVSTQPNQFFFFLAKCFFSPSPSRVQMLLV